MKKSNLYTIIGIIILLIILVILMVNAKGLIWGNNIDDEKKLSVTATFYPQYIALMNIMEGVDDVKYNILNSEHVGCLHDYSITTGDMKKFEDSDAIILNGAGMEETMIDNINELNKKVIDSGEGIETIEGEDETNAHTFLSIQAYIKQVENIRDGLIELDPENSDKYNNNASEYIEKLNDLNTYAEEKFSNISNKKIVTGHTTFDYFARDYGLEVIASLQGDEEEEPSAKELQEIIEKIKSENIKTIFAENDGGIELANTVANDTGAKVYTLDSITGGRLEKNIYIDAMKNNIDMILEALNED